MRRATRIDQIPRPESCGAPPSMNFFGRHPPMVTCANFVDGLVFVPHDEQARSRNMNSCRSVENADASRTPLRRNSRAPRCRKQLKSKCRTQLRLCAPASSDERRRHAAGCRKPAFCSSHVLLQVVPSSNASPGWRISSFLAKTILRIALENAEVLPAKHQQMNPAPLALRRLCAILPGTAA